MGTYVSDFNYDVALVVTADKRGNAKLGWIDLEQGQSIVGKNLHKFTVGGNSENQAACLSVIAAKLANMMQKEELNGKNVLLILPDSVAPRCFEIKGVVNKLGTDAEFDTLRNQVLAKVIKDWMPECWQTSLVEFVTSICCLVTECQASIDCMKKSDLYERELVGSDNFEAGQKIIVKKGGEIEGSSAKVSSYTKEGEYTVLDRSYETKNGKVQRFSINRWENADVPNTVKNLQILNEAVSSALPSVKLLEVKLEA